MLLQITSNFINEVYDYRRGSDREDRVGPKRQVASGVISSRQMTFASILLMILTFALGMVLVAKSGFIVLIIGVFSLVFSFLYTGGPYPLAYKGLGDLFVYVFFGLTATLGTYYVFTLQLDTTILLASQAPGFLAANILGVNNIRDIATDPLSSKFTLAVRIGLNNAIRLYRLMLLLSYLSSVLLAFAESNLSFLLVFLTVPFALILSRDVANKSGKELNPVLAKTGLFMMLYGILTIIAFQFHI